MTSETVYPKSIFASLPKTERGRAIVLGGDPKGKNFLYANNNSVFIRDIENPAICDVYTQHASPVSMARYAPSGFYVASGDARGKIRIWDTTQVEHVLKYESQPLSGLIRDITWSPDSKRLAVVGEGRETFASVFLWDTGTSVGSIHGHSKSINSADYRPTRPFRIVSASEDTNLVFSEGPPFKFKHSLNDHTRFVNCVRYSPDGEMFVSGGADGLALLCDGKSGEIIGQLGPPAHKGGIYGVCFSPDSSQVLTVSGDKSAKIWDVASRQCVVEFPMGNTIEDQQVGCLWQGENVITVSLSGHFNYLDRNNPTEPLRIVKGHNKPITAMCVTEDKSTIFTGSSDALINFWDPVTGRCDGIKGKGHGSMIQNMVIVDDTLITISIDDTIRFTSTISKEYGADAVKLDSQPRGLAAVCGGTVVVGCIKEVVVFENKRKVSALKVPYEPSAVAIHPGRTEVVVGGQDHVVHLYELSGGTLKEKTDVTLQHAGEITDLQYSPDGAYLAACDANKRLIFYQLPDYKNIMESTRHTARVNSVAWTSDSKHLASAGLDTNILVWNIDNLRQPTYSIRAAHPQCNITRVAWINDNTVVSVSVDSTVRQWDIPH